MVKKDIKKIVTGGTFLVSAYTIAIIRATKYKYSNIQKKILKFLPISFFTPIVKLN
ncbi:hypothetical protein [Lactobacillus johnsonii]|uniref:hypothetical protein n=1 Tax=Lactobacillus johnsonii TaxID=33959 RepID=UPI0015D97779|nr:hypothetical protein [Lactobacillus johnsonii]